MGCTAHTSRRKEEGDGHDYLCDREGVWSRAVPELARAIAEGRPHRASGEHVAHLVEIMDAVGTSISRGRPVDVASSFVPPAPMEWA